LNSHLQIESEGEGAAPGDDRGPFDPNQVYQALLIAEMAEPVAFGGFSLSGVLGPLRFLSFWTMKQRAMLFGQSGAADLLTKLREARKQARFHLTGHSFGCIVMSATVAGPPDAGFDEPRADSLVLIQGAMSLWSFCNRIPDRPDRSGYFRRVVDNELVSGPVLATTSLHDKAVRVLYPLAAGVLDQISFGAPGKLPTYGGIGTFGVRGPGIETVDDELHTIDVDYTFRPHVTYNLNCNNVISQTKGLSGAHSDICHPELAHAVFRAADALRP
jgi:pimeloyl-ACP methyl ester carboxylesterase